MSKPIRFKLWQSEKDKQFYCHIVAGNGRITWASEGYPTERIARKNIDATWKAMYRAVTGLAVATRPPEYTKDSL